MKKIMLLAAALLSVAFSVNAQTVFGGVVSVDRTVHDFGDLFLKTGPVSCTFTVRNVSDKDAVIYSVVSSCGCTDVKWTREALKPGAEGTITATYSNDEGAYPFDKTLTVYVSDVKRPIILHLRGVVHDRKKPLAEMYPAHIGPAGLRSLEIKGGNLLQGESKSGEFTVANLSSKPFSIDFKDVSDGLVLFPEGPVAAGQTGRVRFTVKADRSRWGTNEYAATMVCGGRPAGKIAVKAVTKENFSNLTKADRALAAEISLDRSTFTFDPCRIGTSFTASYNVTNTGKSPLVIYKVETDSPGIVSVPGNVRLHPSSLAPGKSAVISFKVDTSGLQAGEQLYMVTLYTNAPLRPMVNIFVAGFLK